MSMKLIQVFEGTPFDEQFADWSNDITNDCYRRWYPKRADEPKSEPWMAELNKWLTENGMDIDSNNKYFHVLIRFSW
jgi:hypothetical protein